MTHDPPCAAGLPGSRVRRVSRWLRLLCLAAVVAAAGAHARILLAFVQSKPANWGLWRIDRPALPDAQAANQFRYVADGTSVNIYIIDSGVYREHHEFTGRTHAVGNFFDHPANPQPTDDVSDCAADGKLPYPWEGHGTHAASYAAGTHSGVAKNAQIWILRASRCQDKEDNGPALIAAVDWIRFNGRHPGVVNISFDVGRSADNSVRDHILAAINPPPPEQGFLYTLSAGGGGDVSSRFGELARHAIVAAVTDRTDAAGAADYGDGLTLFAPGIATLSAACCARGPDAYHVAAVGPLHSGAECSLACDSYAAPVAAGVAATYLQRHPGANPAEVRRAILSGAATVQGLPKPMLQMTRDGPVR
jgi:subtilisin family serine protease